MEASSSNAAAKGKRTEASAFNAPPIDFIVRCVRCRRPCDPCKDQMIRYSKKAMGTFKCNTCNTRGTQLSRLEAWQTMLGSYQSYSAEEKEQFWVDVGEASSLESIKKVVEERLSTKSIQRKNPAPLERTIHVLGMRPMALRAS